MGQYRVIIRLLMKAAKEDALGNQANDQDNSQAGGQYPKKDDKIPVGIPDRRVHLSREDLSDLFGTRYELTEMKGLSQPRQYTCGETITICGPKGVTEKVWILGLVRPRMQVEILSGNSFKLGVKVPARLSGNLDKMLGTIVTGPRGSIQTKEGPMAA